jgi:hypothetical protein
MHSGNQPNVAGSASFTNQAMTVSAGYTCQRLIVTQQPAHQKQLAALAAKRYLQQRPPNLGTAHPQEVTNII